MRIRIASTVLAYQCYYGTYSLLVLGGVAEARNEQISHGHVCLSASPSSLVWSDAHSMIYSALAGVFRPTAAAMVVGQGSAGVVNVKIPREQATDTE